MSKNQTFFFSLFLSMLTNTVVGQTRGDIRFPVGFADLKNIVQQYNAGTCTSTSYDIGSRGKIKFILDLGSGKYLIEVIRNNVNSGTGHNYANVNNNQYCISKADYENFFSIKQPYNGRTAYGFLVGIGHFSAFDLVSG